MKPQRSRCIWAVAVVMFAATAGASARHPAWIARYADDNANYAQAMAVDPAGGVYVAGSAWSQESDSAPGVLVEFDRTGAVLWSTQFYDEPGPRMASFDSMATDAAGNVYVAGSSIGQTNEPADYALLLVKYDSAGQQVRTRRFEAFVGRPTVLPALLWMTRDTCTWRDRRRSAMGSSISR